MAHASKSALQLTALALALASIGAHADTFTWAADTSGLWTLPISWTPVGPPTQNSDVIISVTGMKTITHDLGNDTIHTLTFDQSTPDPTAVLLINTGSSLTVTSGGANGGTIRADNGTMTFSGGTLVNSGTLAAINGGSIGVSNTTISGGALTTSSGGNVTLYNGAVLDGLTNGPITNTGSIVEADNSTAYALGTIHNNGTITIGTTGADGTDFRLLNSNNLTVDGTGTTTLTANARVFADNSGDVLTIGAGQTFQGQGNIGANRLLVVNNGAITANVSGQTLALDPTDGQGNFVNNGTLRATGGGTLQFLTGTYTNNNLITADTGSTVTITNGAIVQGGTISTTGSGTATLYQNSTLDGLTNGAITLTGNVAIGDNQVAYALGTINDNNLTVGTTGVDGTDLRVQNSNNLTLTNNGTTTLINARIFGDNSNDLLTNTAGNTIQGYGNVGANQLYVANAGVITANVGGQTLTVDPTDGNATAPGLVNSGTLRAENGGTLQLFYGIYDNSAGTIQAKTGSTVTITNSANILGGTVSTQGTGQVNLLNGAVLDGQTKGAITLTGNVAVGDNNVVYGLGTINDNTLTIGTTGANGTDFRILDSNNLTLANNGTTTLINARIFADNGNDLLTNTAGNTIQGYGNVGANQMYVANAGVITANVNGQTLTIDPTDGTSAATGLTNTGTMRAENGGTLQIVGGYYNNAGGTITALTNSSLVITNGATIQGGTVSTAGTGTAALYNSSTLDGLTHGAITLTGNVAIGDNNTVYGLGTINDNTLTVGTTGADSTDFRILNNNNLALANNGTTTLINGRIFGDNGIDLLTNTAGNTIQGYGNVGINQLYVANAGLITANVSGQTLTIDPSDGTSTAAGLSNTGTMRAENGGTLQIFGGYYNNAGGTMTAATGSSLVVTNGANIQGGTVSTTGTGTATFYNSAVLDGQTQGALTLTGNVALGDNQTIYALGTVNDNTLSVGTTGADTTDLRLLGSNNLTLANGTTTLVNGRIFGDNGNDLLTNATGNTIQGYGSIGIGQMQLTNAGTINANVSGATINLNTSSTVVNQSTGVLQASNGGTLYIDKAVTGTGTIRTDSGGTVQLNQAAQTGQLINNATLANGTNNVTVSADYNNANFGTGNSFNKRAGITGTGLILAAGDVAQAVTGSTVTNGTSGTPTLTIGNVRVGGTTYNYQVANTGTNGPSIRGAIETNINGGNITDSRLSGIGVTAGNYGPVGAGSNSGNLGVTFTATTAGALAPLSGQAVHIANNFDNLSEQTLNIALASGAAAYNTAVGSTTPTPVTVANQRVGGAGSQALTVSNTAAAGMYSEALDASFSGSTGATTTNGGSVGNIAAGASNTGALAVGVNTSTAGAKTGSVTIAYQTDGTGSNGNSGLAAIGAGSQAINVSGNVYNTAVGSTTPTPVMIANQRVGGTGSQSLTVANTAAAGSYSEALNASFSGTAGTATSNGGSVSNIAAGASNTGALSVGVNTASSGARTGSVTIAYQSDGTGSNGNSGLAAISAGSQGITVSGNVYQTAAGTLLTAPLNFGTVQVGQNVSQTLSVQNSATGAAGYVEDLNASFGAATGTGANKITGTGSVNGLVAGATSNALTVGVNTGSAGTVNASIAVNYVSAGAVNGVSNGLGTLAVGSSSYGVSGTIQGTANVVDQANPVINNSPIAIGAVRIGSTSPTGLVSVTNQATGNQQAALNASISGNAPVTASGSFNGLAPGATTNASLAVGIDTSSAGSKNGTATIAFVSDASNIGGCGTSCQMTLASQDVAVTGSVYRLANPTVSSTPITVAARVGAASPTTAIAVTNTSPDIYTEGLSVSRGATSAGFTSSGSITNLVAGGSSNAIGVTLNTATAGTFSGTQALGYVSTGAGTDGAADISVGSGSVALNGKVYTPAIAQNNTPSVNFGIVHVGDTVTAQGVSVTNAAATTALNDVLIGSAVGATGPFTASGSLGAGLGAQQTSTNGLTVGLGTTTAGNYSGSATFSAASHDSDLSDAALANLAVSLVGQVNNYASDTFSKTAGAGTLTQSGSTFILDYGTLTQNTGTVTSSLVATNDATGPADALSGMFQFLDPADFGENGFGAFMNLAAGMSDGPLSFSFSTATVGTFMDSIILHGVGSNASGYSGAIGDIELIVRGTVDAAGVVTPPNTNVPEPDSLLLLGLGLPLLFLRRGRKQRAR